MTSLADHEFLNLWEQSGEAAQLKIKKFLQAGLDKKIEVAGDTLSKLAVGPEVSNQLVRWMEEWQYPTQITAQLSSYDSTPTLTFTGYLFGEAVDADNVKQVIRVGTILENPTSGVQVKVSDVSGLASTPFTCTVAAYGNTTLTGNDSAALTYDIISEAWSDFKDADAARALDRTIRSVGTQIHAETFEIAKSRKNTAYEVVADEVTHQIDALLDKLRRQLAKAVLRSRPYYSSGYKYGYDTAEPSMCGLSIWPVVTQAELANTNVYRNLSSREIVKDDMDNLALHLWLDEGADYNTGNWWFLCHPLVKQYINDFDISFRRMTQDSKDVGFAIDMFHSKIGKSFPILGDPYMRPSEMLLVNFSKVSYGYYKNDRMDRKELQTQGRYQRWLLSFQTYGIVARNPRANIGKIYGISYS